MDGEINTQQPKDVFVDLHFDLGPLIVRKLSHSGAMFKRSLRLHKFHENMKMTN